MAWVTLRRDILGGGDRDVSLPGGSEGVIGWSGQLIHQALVLIESDLKT